jgi:hypothetical protein
MWWNIPTIYHYHKHQHNLRISEITHNLDHKQETNAVVGLQCHNILSTKNAHKLEKMQYMSDVW